MVKRRERAGMRGNASDLQDKSGRGPTSGAGGATPGSAMPAGGDAMFDAALPPGYLLHEFQIERVLGQGGFGIVYLAHDLQLRRTVALKEYMPSSLAMRQGGSAVVVRSEQRRETFELGLRSFVNEARLLASFDNRALVEVYRFWEQNGTAYMVMPYYQGPTLKAWLAAQDGPPGETWLKHLLGPLLDVLALIHADHCYHRDIAPDNILLLGETHPLLLDFGAARRVIGDATQALTVMLKPGYAPVEQYAEAPSMKQGPWTDVYALCAVLYMAITGRAPMASVGRMMKDEMVPLSVSAAGRYSPAFLAAIDAGLAVLPERRPQDIAALRARLFASGDDEATVLVGHVGTEGRPFVDRRRQVPPTEPGATLAGVTPGATVPEVTDTPEPLPPLPRRRWGILAAGAVLAAAGGLWFAMQDRPAPPKAVAQVTPPPAAPRGPTMPTAPVRPAYSAAAALDDLVAHADAHIEVRTVPAKARIVIGTDLMQFRVSSNQAGFVYVFLVGTDSTDLQLLFPNGLDRNNRIDAGVPLTLPRKGWEITAGGPPGVNRIVTMVSRAPREFGAAGLQAGATIAQFDPARARLLWAAAPPGQAAFAGQASCPAGAPCEAGYGATLMQIEEVAAP